MTGAIMDRNGTRAPRRGKGPKRRSSYAEGVDESPQLIESEPVDIEQSLPAEERSSVESLPPEEKTPAVFEE